MHIICQILLGLVELIKENAFCNAGVSIAVLFIRENTVQIQIL